MNMKNTSTLLFRIPGVMICATACLLALPMESQAKDHNKNNRQNQNQNQNHNQNQNQNPANNSAQAVAGFVLALANGYAGPGYYYGPANTSYYNRNPQVVYYATREAAPRAYYGYGVHGSSMASAVQQALARAGYYNGPIDGSLGPISRRAISNYQADRGMRVTGALSSGLINSLGLQ